MLDFIIGVAAELFRAERERKIQNKNIYMYMSQLGLESTCTPRRSTTGASAL